MVSIEKKLEFRGSSSDALLSGAKGIHTIALGGRLGPVIASRGFVEGNEDAKELPPCSVRDAKELNGACDADLLLINER